MKLQAGIEQIDEVASRLLRAYPDHRIYAIEGPMGAGKTTLVQAMGAQLGLIDQVSSPTFSLINEYHRQDGSPVFHFDFYRIEDVSEAFDIGYEHYLYSGNYCFIEWPERIRQLLPENIVYIRILIPDDRLRAYHLRLLS